ncbi:metal ABC transporter permease [Actinomadura keratinilytica]
MDLFDYAFMQRALLAAVLVGLTAPAIGTYLVQRRQAIMGDGIGHVAMTGVALGFLLNTSPVWMATAVAVLGSVGMELIRSRGRTSGDVALALLFTAAWPRCHDHQPGAGRLHRQPQHLPLRLHHHGLPEDLTAVVVLALLVLAVTLGLRRQLFAVCQDEEFARVTGLPVRLLNLVIAVTAAVTVTVAMRIVGLLLVSAMMVIPVAAAQRLTKGFGATLARAMVIGVVVSSPAPSPRTTWTLPRAPPSSCWPSWSS